MGLLIEMNLLCPSICSYDGINRMLRCIRSRATAVAAAVLLLPLVTASPAVARPQAADPTSDPRVSEVRALVRLVYAAMRAGLAADQRPFGWSNDFFKGTEGTAYVPFTLTVDRTKLRTPAATLYVLVTPHAGPTDRTSPPGGPGRLEPEELRGPPPRAIAFEAMYFIDLTAPTADQGGDYYRVRRALSLKAGDYDVYAALGSLRQTRGRGESSVRREADDMDDVMMIKRELSVPDLWTAELATSTVVLVESVEPIEAPLPTDQQIVDPYVLGTTRIAPAAAADFQPTEQLAVTFWVYNTGLTPDRQPDVTVDYLLYQRHAGGESCLGKTNQQEFNAQTQGGFDIDAGHELLFVQAIPLDTLTAGAYRLEIQVNDNTSGASVTRHVEFTVRGW